MARIQIIQSDLLNETRGIIVHGVNAQGVMGSGIALQIKERYHQVYRDYLKTCDNIKYDPDTLMFNTPQESLLGKIVTTPCLNGLIIISGFTQLYYGRNPSVQYANYDAIKQVFQQVNQIALHLNLPVKMPKIGAGLANGNWDIIKNIITDTFSDKVDVQVFQLE